MLRNEQITSLCEELLKAGEEGALEIAARLKAALHEHLETIRGNLLLSIAQEVPGNTPQDQIGPSPSNKRP